MVRNSNTRPTMTTSEYPQHTSLFNFENTPPSDNNTTNTTTTTTTTTSDRTSNEKIGKSNSEGHSPPKDRGDGLVGLFSGIKRRRERRDRSAFLVSGGGIGEGLDLDVGESFSSSSSSSSSPSVVASGFSSSSPSNLPDVCCTDGAQHTLSWFVEFE